MQREHIEGPAPRVLLVDDDAETLVLLRAALEGEGIDIVGAAGDGSEVETLVEKTEPDVVLMDLRMPGMDGFEATVGIKARYPWVQVIFLTFYEEMLPPRGPQEVGAFAYLVKGCSTELMRDVIFQARRHGSEQRWRRANRV
ncbi:MAG: response regulator [Actinobacteria bacterium]|nr:MAG: response regulator [Actinomycetota bacterium]